MRDILEDILQRATVSQTGIRGRSWSGRSDGEVGVLPPAGGVVAGRLRSKENGFGGLVNYRL